jgi:methionyl-tRNA formyltransferase
MSRAVVFAYHTVGVRCLKTLLAAGVEVPLVITHQDNPGEGIWFESVRQTAEDYEIPCLAPDDPNTDGVLAAVRGGTPDFLFSFYYRQLLKAPLLAVPARGAFNMHGSLLPRYRGRVPINWAIINGEVETGATLHVMDEKPDHGAIVDQLAVPILPDDSAPEVFTKVSVAAEIVLWRSLPGLLGGTAGRREQDPALATYFGGRRPADGKIDGSIGAKALHDFVRGLSKPYPGAFAEVAGHCLVLWKTRFASAGVRERKKPPPRAILSVEDERLIVQTADGGKLHLVEADLDGEPLDAARFRRVFPLGKVELR